jgi:hypothetical protein
MVENKSVSWRKFKKGILLRGVLLGLVVLGAKWTLVFLFGGEVPFGDQWDAEVVGLYQPLQAGEFDNASIFTTHNEHRIAATRLLSILMFKIAGDQIDPRLQMVVSTAIHAFWFGMIGVWLARWLRPSFHPLLFIFLIVLGVAPYAYENTLWPFQSQVYFNLLFWSIAIWGLALGHFTSVRWWCGLMAGICGVLSFGAGGLVGVALVAVICLRGLIKRRIEGSEVLTVLVSIGLVVLGYTLRGEVEQHNVLQADSWATFALAFIRLIAWPANIGLPIGILLWIPGVWLILELVGGRQKTSDLSDVAVSVIVLAVANIGATALFRGQNVVSEGIAPRYLDLFSVGLIGNFLALYLLVKARVGGIAFRRSFVLTWLVVVGLSFGAIGLHITSKSLPFWKQSANQQLARIRAYLHSGDERVFEGKSIWETSYPNPKRLAKILNTPDLEEILPPGLHQGMARGLLLQGTSQYKEGDIDPRFPPSTSYRIWGNWSLQGKEEKSMVRDDVLWFESDGGYALWTHVISPDAGPVIFVFKPEGSEEPIFIEERGRTSQTYWRETTLKLPRGRILLSVVDNREIGWAGVTLPRPISSWGLLARYLLGLGPILFAGSMLSLTFIVWWPFRLRRH